MTYINRWRLLVMRTWWHQVFRTVMVTVTQQRWPTCLLTFCTASEHFKWGTCLTSKSKYALDSILVRKAQCTHTYTNNFQKFGVFCGDFFVVAFFCFYWDKIVENWQEVREREGDRIGKDTRARTPTRSATALRVEALPQGFNTVKIAISWNYKFKITVFYFIVKHFTSTLCPSHKVKNQPYNFNDKNGLVLHHQTEHSAKCKYVFTLDPLMVVYS